MSARRLVSLVCGGAGTKIDGLRQLDEEARPPITSLQITWFDHAISAFLVHQITLKALPDETASSRLKQVGIMMLVFDLYDRGTPVTLAALAKASGLTRGGVYDSVDFLIRRGLLIETIVKNSMRRGQARLFSIAPAVIVSLRSFLG